MSKNTKVIKFLQVNKLVLPMASIITALCLYLTAHWLVKSKLIYLIYLAFAYVLCLFGIGNIIIFLMKYSQCNNTKVTNKTECKHKGKDISVGVNVLAFVSGIGIGVIIRYLIK